MPDFQSYLIVAPKLEAAREETKKIAAGLGINLEKVSGDIFIITAAKQEISIDQIRQLKSHIYQKPLEYPFKFVIIENAATATTEAQNSLLKILEEPPPHAILVLEAKNKALLLPTITSRTILIKTESVEKDTKSETLLDQSLESALERISAQEDAREFLDREIVSLNRKLEQKASGHKTKFTYFDLASAIEKCARAKEMVGANVNPTFTLANLVFSLNLASK